MKFIHLTDLHVTVPGRRLFGQEPNHVVKRAVASINEAHLDAELCVITGDITHDGTREEYEAAQRILDELKVPYIATVGNHDTRDAARGTMSGLLWDVNGFAQGVRNTSAGLFLLLDTKTEGTHGGSFCKTRLAWLKDLLHDHPETPIHVFMHHPPMLTGLPGMDQIAMDPGGQARLADVFAEHGGVKTLFFGHFHRPMSGTWHGISFSSHRSMMLQCALDMRTQDSIPGVFEEPQYAVVEITDEMTRIHYHDFDSSAERVSMGGVED